MFAMGVHDGEQCGKYLDCECEVKCHRRSLTLSRKIRNPDMGEPARDFCPISRREYQVMD